MLTPGTKSTRPVLAFLALVVSAPVALATPTTVSPVAVEDAEPGGPSLEIKADDGSPSTTYATDNAVQMGAVATIALLSGASWDCCDNGVDDVLKVSYTVSGTGTLPTMAQLSALVFSGSSLSMNAITRTFASSKEAAEMAIALSAARLLPSGVSLSENGGVIKLTVDLEEAWIDD